MSIYSKSFNFYVIELSYMTRFVDSIKGLGLLQWRLLRHGCFWLAYYLVFSLIWASPQRGYYVSFYLEFVLMPLRILASYCMMYVLIPLFLSNRKMLHFITSYCVLITLSAGVQMLIGHFFYDQLLGGHGERFPFSVASWVRNAVLINSTVILLGAAKILQLHFQLLDSLAVEEEVEIDQDRSADEKFIEVKSNRRIHRLRINEILYIEGLGNYITYVNIDDSRIIVYSSLKATEALLPHAFIRLHRSYIVNRKHINAYDKDTVTVGKKSLPRGKDVTDDLLKH